MSVLFSDEWTTSVPRQDPRPPAIMSYSTLLEIEACPRRWCMRHSYYPSFGRGGYPDRIFFGSLRGLIVHRAVEEIVRRLVDARCEAIRDPQAISVLRLMGGLTNVIRSAHDAVLEQVGVNFRFRREEKRLRFRLAGATGEIHSTVQGILSHTPRMVVPTRAATVNVSSAAPATRIPLANGTYPELVIEADDLGWRGVADLLVLADEACTIVDYKTGEPDPEHAEQLRTYAVLWAHDRALNPGGRPCTALRLNYSGETREVPAPTSDAQRELALQLVRRKQAAVETVSRAPPEARVSEKNCQYCPVRHLCDPFWDATTVVATARSGPADLQLRILRKRAPLLWDVSIERPRQPVPTREAILHVRAEERRVRAGQRLRLLQADLSVEAAGEPPVISAREGTEVFLLEG